VTFFIWLFYIRALRESWKRILFVVWDSIQILFILIAYILFFSVIAYILFSGSTYHDPAEYFKDIPTTIFNMFVLFTTSNYPDILFPFWKVHNLSAIFFTAFLLIGLYMLLNLMLAVFYNSYKK